MANPGSAHRERDAMEVVQFSLPKVRRRCAQEAAPATGVAAPLAGKFTCETGVTVGRQRWPVDYAVILLTGEAIVQGPSGDPVRLASGQGALWRADEEWAVEAMGHVEALTLQGEELDVEDLRAKASL